MLIRDMPADERPMERLATHGPHTLSDAELCAVILDADSLDEARAIVAKGLKELSKTDWRIKLNTKVAQRKRARLLASLELGRRIQAASDTDRDPVRDPMGIARSLVARYGHHQQERLGAVFLDAKSRPIVEREIYIGTINATRVSTRDILRIALDVGAVSVILFHNHPSGDPSPSSDDLLFTRQMVEAGNLLGVEVIDHLILGFNKYVSLKQRGIIP